MKYLKLNDTFDIKSNVTIADNDAPETQISKNGNPAKNQELEIKWNNSWDMGSDVHFDLGKSVYVDSAVFHFGQGQRVL